MAKTITSFKPGQSGNPKGGPKREWTWSGLLEQAGEEIYTDKNGTKIQFKAMVTKRLWLEAAKGDMVAIKEIFNRMDGMPKQSVALGGEDGNAITIKIEDYGNNNKTTTKTA